jgi:hypothetical protein
MDRLFQTLGSLTEADLLKKVTIRREERSVLQAIHRSLTHTSYHVGQIVYLFRLMTKGGWEWITISPGQSQQVKAKGGKYLKDAETWTAMARCLGEAPAVAGLYFGIPWR